MTPLAQVHAAHWDANQAGCVCGDKSAPQGPLWHEHVAAAMAAALNADHDCATCTECLHDGRKCCGCYDGACCHTEATP